MKTTRTNALGRRLLVIGLMILIGVTLFVYLSPQEKLPQAVMQWRDQVLDQMKRQGLSEDWIDVLMAQLMQESSGVHTDLFQCSESKYGVPGMIQSEEESIEQAVYYWTLLIQRAGELGITPSKENLLQSYNMGIGYLDYLAYHKSDTTEELASAFSRDALAGGGDYQYVSHVLRYLEMAKAS